MRRASIGVWLATAAWVGCAAPGALAAGKEAAGAKAEFHAMIFDFACDQGTYGAQISDSLRLRLRRHKEYDVLSRLDTQDFTEPIPFEAGPKKVIDELKRMGLNLGIHGTVTKSGANVTAKVRCIRLQDGKPVLWEQTFRDDTQRARGEIARHIVEKLRGQAEWTPPQYGDEEEPKKFGRPYNRNGSFEARHLGWDRPDNVSTFIEPGPAGRGKILRVRTDLARDPWLAYRRALRLGQTTPDRPPRIARDTSYGSVAGLEGVHFRSEWLTSIPFQRWWMTCDANKCGGTPKIFVKGFLDWRDRADGLPESSLARLGMTPGQFAALPEARRKQLIEQDVKRRPEQYRRECYRWYLNLRGPSNQWHHYAAVCPPRGGMPDNVKWLSIQVYSYWPPGTYLWDNVHLYKDPRQTAPAPVEGARTPHFGKTSDVVEALEAIKEKVKQKKAELLELRKAGKKEEAAKVAREIQQLMKQGTDIVEKMRKYQSKDATP